MGVFANVTLAILRIMRVRLTQRWQQRLLINDEVGLIHR